MAFLTILMAPFLFLIGVEKMFRALGSNGGEAPTRHDGERKWRFYARWIAWAILTAALLVAMLGAQP